MVVCMEKGTNGLELDCYTAKIKIMQHISYVHYTTVLKDKHCQQLLLEVMTGFCNAGSLFCNFFGCMGHCLFCVGSDR